MAEPGFEPGPALQLFTMLTTPAMSLWSSPFPGFKTNVQEGMNRKRPDTMPPPSIRPANQEALTQALSSIWLWEGLGLKCPGIPVRPAQVPSGLAQR